MGVKSTVKLYRAQPEMAFIHAEVRALFAELDVPCDITSVMDSRHMSLSLHGAGYAIDYRSKGMSQSLKDEILTELKARLGFMCDILLEDLGGPNEHFHVEFDPKGDMEFVHDKEIYRSTGTWPGRV